MKKPRVIWLGVSEGSTELTALAKIIQDRLVKLGFPHEKRKYSPHLTLGRVKRLTQDGRNMIEKLLKEEDYIPSTLESISTVYLKKSTLTPKGAIYENLANVSLK